MDGDRLAQLGLQLDEASGGLEAALPLTEGVVNPLTRRVVPSVTFALAEDRLIPVEPPELVGLPPLSVTDVPDRAELEARLLASFAEHLRSLQDTVAALRSLGVVARVEPDSLELQGEIELPEARVVLVGDKRGSLRVSRIHRAGARIATDVGAPFSPARFLDRAALEAFLRELVPADAAEETREDGEAPAPVRDAEPRPGVAPGAEAGDAGGSGSARRRPGVTFVELAERFGTAARAPDAGHVEIVADFRVRGERFRFVAARLKGRLFRGLLAGPDGKKWADHFALEDFEGVADVAARALGVRPDEVEWIEAEGTA